MSGDLSWKVHIETRLKKANQVLYLLRRNLSANINTFVKLGLYKLLILPVLLYGLSCTHISRGDQLQLERFQKKVIRWITGNKTGVYINELRLLNILPLPMFIQLNNILLLASLHSNERNEIVLNRRTTRARNTEIFEMQKVRTEKARNEFVFRTSRIVNRLEPYIHFDKRIGLKTRILNTMWKFVNERFSEMTTCTWQLFCDCITCRNKWTLF